MKNINENIDENEIKKFAAMAQEWWNENGKLKSLHQFNPIRLTYLREKLLAHFGLDGAAFAPLTNLKILDIGCGGGLICEPLARLGAQMTGIDPIAANIEIAKAHSQNSALNINYRCTTIENLNDEKFDVILILEVIEHINNIESFIAAATRNLKPGGLIFIATLNRTIKSYLLAIVGAEYILRLLPIGTHDWRKFLKPAEIYQIANNNSLKLLDSCGFSFNPLCKSWKKNNDLSVNYIMTYEKNN